MNLLGFLKQKGIDYEDLNAAERETLNRWMQNLATKQLTVEGIKEYVEKMKTAVESELAAYDLPKEKDLLLKARLKNYIMLYDFLTAPEKARKYVEAQLNNLKK